MILDTCFIIDILEGDIGARNKLQELYVRGESVMISAITLFELSEGIALSKFAEKEKEIRREAIESLSQ